MKKYLKRFSALFVVVAMLVAMIPMTMLAKQGDKKPTNYDFHFSANDDNLGKVSTQSVSKEDGVVVKTAQNDRFTVYRDENLSTASTKTSDAVFIGWQVKNTLVTTENTDFFKKNKYSEFTTDGNNIYFTAVFANKKTQSFASMDESKGTVTLTSADLNDYYDVTIDGEALEFNGDVICEANAEKGYLFAGWTVDDGQNVETTGTILAKDKVGTKTIKAVFTKAGYEVVTYPTASNITYGTALIATGIAKNGSVKYNGENIVFGNANNNYKWDWDHKETVPTVDPTETNTYKLNLQKKSSGSWKNTGFSVEIPVPVTQNPVAITWTVGKYTYNGQVQPYPTAKYKDINDTYIDCTVQINDEKEFKNYDANGYSFTATTDDENYKLINETISDVQIGKAPLTVEWTYDEPYVYGDGKTAPTAAVKGAVNNEKPVLTTPEEVNGKTFENAGEYQFKTKLTDDEVNANYYLQGTYGWSHIYSEKVYILAKGVDLPQAVTGLVYNGEEQAGVSVGSQDPVDLINWQGVEAGTYQATVKLSDKNNYYWNPWKRHGRQDTRDKSVQFTITPKDPEKADFVFTAPKNLEFTGDNKTAEVKLLDKYTDTDSEKAKNVVSLKYYKDGEETTNTYLPGTYTVKATVAVGNFTAAEAEVGSFTVQGIDITEGDGSKYVIGQDGTLTFKSNGPYPLFEGIKIDGKTVDPSKYDKKAGSTYVTLHRDYVESLGAGEHTIQFIYDYNVSSNVADFTIQKPATPKTGDTNSTVVWIVLSAIAALAIFGCAYRVFRSEN